MIQTKAQLKEVLTKEFALYFSGKKDYYISTIICSRSARVWKYQKLLRYLEYFKSRKNGLGGAFYTIMFALYSRRVNKLGMKLGIDTWCDVFDEGLHMHHVAGGIIVNSEARIGKNCELHGQNCIGNNGKPGGKSPVIGDNCKVGVGAKIIGDIQIGNNIIIAAGAVVVKSINEDGVILAGVPAEIVKRTVG